MITIQFIDTRHVKRDTSGDQAAVAAAFADWGPPLTTFQLMEAQGFYRPVITESPPCHGHSRPHPVDLQKLPDGSWGLPR
jgi:hypothetical protein